MILRMVDRYRKQKLTQTRPPEHRYAVKHKLRDTENNREYKLQERSKGQTSKTVV